MSVGALGVSAFLAVYVLGSNPRRLANRSFFALMMTFVWWDACEAVLRAMPADASASALYPWVQGVWLGISAVPAALMQLGLTYPETRPWFRRYMLLLVYAPLLGWAFLIFGTSHLIAGVADGMFGPSARVGDLYLPLAITYAAWFYLSVALFIANWGRVRGSPLGRMQGVVVLGLLLGSIPAGITEMFWPLIDGFNTQLGLSSVYTLIWSIFLAFAIARYHYLVIEPVTEPRPATRARHSLGRGLNYLVLEAGRASGMGAFREIVSTTPGLCVTGLAPARVASRFGLERTPVVWITRVSSAERTVRPESLDFELLHTILKFLRENPGTAVLVDDVDYLASLDGFEAVARFLKRVANQASAANGTLILTAGRNTLTPDQVALLSGCVDHTLEIHELADAPLDITRDNALVFRSPQDLPLALPALAVRAGLVVTTDHPSKIHRRFDEAFSVLWITAHPEAGLPCTRPTALDTEARRAVSNYLSSTTSGVLLLAGLEQIALVAGFPALLAFVKDVADLAAVHGGRVIASVTPGSLGARELAMIARRLDVPPALLLTGSPLGALSTAAPGSRTPSRGPVS